MSETKTDQKKTSEPFRLKDCDLSKGIHDDLVPFLARFKNELQRPSLYLMIFGFFAGLLIYDGYVKCGGILFFATLYFIKRSQKETKESNVNRCLKKLNENPQKIREFLLKVNAPQVFEGSTDDTQRSQWVNDLLFRLWPFINSTVQKEIDDKGYADINRGLDIGNGRIIRFDKFTLGDKPPQVTHVAVNKSRTRTDELVLEMQVLYFGNCLLSFSKRTVGLINMKAGVKDIYFRGKGRFVMRPLLDYPPYFGGCTFCLLERPILDYDGINLANLADNRLFKNFLLGIIESFIVSPNKLYVPIIQEPDIKRQLKLALPVKLCYFEVIEAEKLPAMDTGIFSFTGQSDPFCIIRVAGYQFETVVCYNTLNPCWRESHTVPIHDLYENFKIEVWDKDALSADDFIGYVQFQIKDITDDKSFNGADKWLPLGKASTGSIHFRVACFNLIKDDGRLTNTNEDSKVKLPAGLLSVYIYHLTLLMKNSDTRPVLHLKFSGQQFQTDPLEPDASPRPEDSVTVYTIETCHHFVCNNPELDTLEITVMDASGVKLSKLAKAGAPWKEIIGTHAIPVLDNICTADKRTLDKSFDLHLGRESKGNIKMFICLQGMEMDDVLQENLNKPVDIRGRIDQATSDTSFIGRIMMQPTASLTHPIKTLKTLKNTEVPFFGRTTVPVADDMSPAPRSVGKDCHVKIRLKWPERSTLYVEVLRVINVPGVFISDKYRFMVTIQLGRSDTAHKKNDKRNASVRHTHKVHLKSDTGVAVFNERLSFSVAAHQYIENYTAQITLKAISRKAGCLCINESNSIASNVTKIPPIAFRSDPSEYWYKLTNMETPNK